MTYIKNTKRESIYYNRYYVAVAQNFKMPKNNTFLKKYKQEDIKKSVLSLLKENLLSEIQKKEICYLQKGEL